MFIKKNDWSVLKQILKQKYTIYYNFFFKLINMLFLWVIFVLEYQSTKRESFLNLARISPYYS